MYAIQTVGYGFVSDWVQLLGCMPYKLWLAVEGRILYFIRGIEGRVEMVESMLQGMLQKVFDVCIKVEQSLAILLCLEAYQDHLFFIFDFIF